MILIKNFYAFILYMSDSGLQCNKHNSYWYRVQYQDRVNIVKKNTPIKQCVRTLLLDSKVYSSNPTHGEVYTIQHLYNSYWYGGQYQDIHTAQGSWYGPVPKMKHLIGWTLSMWPSLFRDIDWNADIDRSKNRVDWYYWSIHEYLFAYILINYNVIYNLILFHILSWTLYSDMQ
jgi:hypothetical protein